MLACIQFTWLHLTAHVLLPDTLADAVFLNLDSRVAAMYPREIVTVIPAVTPMAIAAVTSVAFNVLLVSGCSKVLTMISY